MGPRRVTVEATRVCLACGYPSVAGEPFCPHCGAAVLGTAAAAPSAAPPTPPPPVGHEPWGTPSPTPNYTPYVDSGRRQMVDRTKSGLTLLIVGSLLGWIPVISVIGDFLVLIGAILVILGRDAFGSAHSRNAMIAVGLYIIGLFAAVVLVLGFASSVNAAVNLPSAEAEPAITSAFAGLTEGAIVAGTFTGLASVLFLYGLLNTTGKVLIWASLILSLLIAAFVYASIMNQLPAALAAVYATSPPSSAPLVALNDQIQSLRLFDVIPQVLAAGAAYVALLRISNGEIPAPPPWETPPANGPVQPPQ